MRVMHNQWVLKGLGAMVLYGSQALNRYLDPAYWVECRDVDLLFEWHDDDVTDCARMGELYELVETVRGELLESTCKKESWPVASLAATVTFVSCGAYSLHVFVHGERVADVTLMGSSRAKLWRKLHPRRRICVMLDDGTDMPLETIALSEVWCRLMGVVSGCRLPDDTPNSPPETNLQAVEFAARRAALLVMRGLVVAAVPDWTHAAPQPWRARAVAPQCWSFHTKGLKAVTMMRSALATVTSSQMLTAAASSVGVGVSVSVGVVAHSRKQSQTRLQLRLQRHVASVGIAAAPAPAVVTALAGLSLVPCQVTDAVPSSFQAKRRKLNKKIAVNTLNSVAKTVTAAMVAFWDSVEKTFPKRVAATLQAFDGKLQRASGNLDRLRARLSARKREENHRLQVIVKLTDALLYARRGIASQARGMHALNLLINKQLDGLYRSVSLKHMPLEMSTADHEALMYSLVFRDVVGGIIANFGGAVDLYPLNNTADMAMKMQMTVGPDVVTEVGKIAAITRQLVKSVLHSSSQAAMRIRAMRNMEAALRMGLSAIPVPHLRQEDIALMISRSAHSRSVYCSAPDTGMTSSSHGSTGVHAGAGSGVGSGAGSGAGLDEGLPCLLCGATAVTLGLPSAAAVPTPVPVPVPSLARNIVVPPMPALKACATVVASYGTSDPEVYLATVAAVADATSSDVCFMETQVVEMVVDAVITPMVEMAANLHAVFKKCCKEVQACSEIVIHTHDNVLGRLNGVFAECKLFVEQDSV